MATQSQIFFLSLYCVTCSDTEFHLLNQEGKFDCLLCRSKGIQTTRDAPAQPLPHPLSYTVSIWPQDKK